MDLVTAFSLACGVIQVVDFSLKLLSKSKEVYEKGSLEQNDSLEYLTHHLSDLKLELQTPHNNNPHGRAQSQDEQDLKQLADKCSETAEKLLIALAKLKVSDPKKKSQVVKVSLRAMLKRSTLKEMEEKMNSYRDVLNTKILVELRKQINTAAVQQSDSFKKIDVHLQKLLLSFAKQSYSFEQLTQLIDKKNKTTREFIGRELKQLEVSAAERKCQDDFLAGLHFPEINCRQEEIKDTYKRTFQWIFDQSGKNVRPWSNFIDWLQNGAGTYWISGKPGSGKSTLMNYICQDERTEDALNAWAGGRKLLIPTFFFWAAGCQLQKSVPGLLRSLIYQILKSNRSLITAFNRRGSPPGSHESCPYGPEPNSVWTEKKLLIYFSTLVETIAESHRICFFIDGLDEFDGDHYELIDVVSKMTKKEGIKCCVSSRPEKPFQGFGSSSMLRLQDLTRSDIEEYVQSKLGALPQMANLPAEDQNRKLRLMKSVANKADGVFLWVELVVKNQIIGIHFDDSFETLRQRLCSLPPKVEDLYLNMLNRIDPAHYQEAAKYLHTRLHMDFSSVFNFAIINYGLADNMRLNSQGLHSEAVLSKCALVHDRINTICVGFLETYESSSVDLSLLDPEWFNANAQEWLYWEQDKSLVTRFETDWSRRLIRFCHRTAYDFFKESKGSGRRFLDLNSTFKSDVFCLKATVLLARMSMCNSVDSRDFMSLMIYCTMRLLRELDELYYSSPALKKFLEYVDRTISAFDGRLNRPLDDSHWCTRWGKYNKSAARFVAPKAVDHKIASNVDSAENSPNEFLSFAMSHELTYYACDVLSQPDFNINCNRATHLAICATARVNAWGPRGGWREWQILSRSQLALVARLVGLGADPRKGLNWSIWEEVVRFLYYELYSERSLGLEEPSESHPQMMFHLPQILETFFATGVDPYPIIHLNFSAVNSRLGSVYFECDTSLVTWNWPIFESHEKAVWTKLLEGAQGKDPTIKPLRIWFYQPFKFEYLPQEGYLMTEEQIHSLHIEIGKVLQHSANSTLDFFERPKALSRVIEDIHDYFYQRQYVNCLKPPNLESGSEWASSEGDDEDDEDW